MVVEGKDAEIIIGDSDHRRHVNCRSVMLPLGQIDKNADAIDKDAKTGIGNEEFKLNNSISFKFKVDVKQVKEIKDRILNNIRGWEITANSITSNKIQLKTGLSPDKVVIDEFNNMINEYDGTREDQIEKLKLTKKLKRKLVF